MTTNEAIHKVCSLAYGEVGYKEGANNYNKYAENPLVCDAIGWDVQRQPWCAVFVVWLFIESFGFYSGSHMMYGCSAGCRNQADFYKDNGAFYPTPQKGDQIFFYAEGDINHTGLVVDVSGSTITTVEGNYSDMVSQNTYFVGDPSIAGYGRPNWAIVADDDEDDSQPEPEPIPEEREYKKLHYPMGMMAPMQSVKAWQNILLCWGYDLGRSGADGEFGVLTMQRTKDLQKRVGITVDGVVGEETWQQGIRIPVKGVPR